MNALDSTFASRSRRTSLPATARILFTLLERMDFGALTLTTPDAITRRFGPGGSVGALDGEVDLIGETQGLRLKTRSFVSGRRLGPCNK